MAPRPVQAVDGAAQLAQVEAALRAGGASEALGICARTIALDAANAAAHRHLAVLLAASGDRGGAIAAGKRACELAPEDPRSWAELGRAFALLGDLEDAATCFREAVDVDERCADGWHNLGVALRKLGRFEQAFAALKRALLVDPARADTYLALGNLLIESDQLEDALECFERAAGHDPTLARARSRLADQLAANGDLDRAESLFRQSLALDPDHVRGWLGLARALEDIGDADAALGCYRNALARRPGYAPALAGFFGLLRAAAPQPLLASAEALVRDAATHDESRALVAYGLAKYHDRRKDFVRAASAATIANRARRRLAGPLDRARLAERVDGLVAAFGPAFFAARTGYGMGTDQPVFIVGLPRSGTTLTEQIIAAHPLLEGAGELPDLARLAQRAAEPRGRRRWEAAAALDAARSRGLAQQYLRSLRDTRPRSALRISDKSPLNLFNLAFAALLFPNARVIHCRRDALDNALSIWFENFNPEQRYATDFADLAFFSRQCDRLLAHWQRALPLRMLEVRYEDTVADVEAQARRIMKFLAVPWDRRCLEFHDTGRAVQTPSRWQVREPIYARSVQRWRNYAELLPELETAFRDDETS
jgi:tetratricopeptide (TPR) repeat protein